MRPTPAVIAGLSLIAVAAVVTAMQTTMQPVPFDQVFYRLCVLSFIAITLAVSLNMVNGFTGQFSLGHAAFLGIGMYVGMYLANTLESPSLAAVPGPAAIRQAVALLLLLAAGGGVAALGGLLVGLPSLRLRGDYLAILTLGFGEIVRVTIQNLNAVGASRGYQLSATRAVPSTDALFFWAAALAVVSVLVSRNLVLSGPGRAFLAVREDEIAAESVGVNTYRAKVLAFVLAAVFAGMAGVINGLYNGYADPTIQTIGFMRSFEVVVMVVLGGLGSITGAVIAATVLTILPEGLRGFSEYRMVVYALVLIILMLVRPRGILGTHEFSLDDWLRRVTRSRAGDT